MFSSLWFFFSYLLSEKPTKGIFSFSFLFLLKTVLLLGFEAAFEGVAVFSGHQRPEGETSNSPHHATTVSNNIHSPLVVATFAEGSPRPKSPPSRSSAGLAVPCWPQGPATATAPAPRSPQAVPREAGTALAGLSPLLEAQHLRPTGLPGPEGEERPRQTLSFLPLVS